MDSSLINAAALRERRCEPCEGGVEPLNGTEARRLLASLDDAWALSEDGRSLARSMAFAGWNRAIAFANAVSWIANTEGHHPVIELGYGYCNVVWTTHAIDGLSVNDFICAAKTDQLLDAV
ncbi:MAG: 4a-hydroxytetrahydrobiopterin dehydratase [Pseudomonadota bacterium]